MADIFLMLAGVTKEKMAEAEGFEPSMKQSPMPNSQFGALNHSTTPPVHNCANSDSIAR